MKTKRRVQLTIGLMVIAGTVGCAHTGMRGSVAMKTAPNVGHVCLGDNEVKMGDVVSLFKSECTRNSDREKGGGSTCSKIFVAKGTVTELLNHHYSTVSFPEGVTIQEGWIVEKN